MWEESILVYGLQLTAYTPFLDLRKELCVRFYGLTRLQSSRRRARAMWEKVPEATEPFSMQKRFADLSPLLVVRSVCWIFVC